MTAKPLKSRNLEGVKEMKVHESTSCDIFIASSRSLREDVTSEPLKSRNLGGVEGMEAHGKRLRWGVLTKWDLASVGVSRVKR